MYNFIFDLFQTWIINCNRYHGCSLLLRFLFSRLNKWFSPKTFPNKSIFCVVFNLFDYDGFGKEDSWQQQGRNILSPILLCKYPIHKAPILISLFFFHFLSCLTIIVLTVILCLSMMAIDDGSQRNASVGIYLSFYILFPVFPLSNSPCCSQPWLCSMLKIAVVRSHLIIQHKT